MTRVVVKEKICSLFMKSPFEDKGVNKKFQKLLRELDNKNLNLMPSENILTETVRNSMFIEIGNR